MIENQPPLPAADFARTSRQPTATRTILCAEDEPELRRDIVEELREAGYHVIEASHGADALTAITSLQPDIVLCDINMPGMTGLQVLEQVRASDTVIADIPFIFLTAFGEKSDILRGHRLGADDYLVKPIDYDLLLATLDARLGSVSRAQRRVADHARQIEQQLHDLLAQGDAEPEGGEKLRALLAGGTLPDCLLVLASLDSYRHLTPQFGRQAAARVLAEYQRAFSAVGGDLPARHFQLERDVFTLLIEGPHGWEAASTRVAALLDTTLRNDGLTLPVTSTVSIVEYRAGDRRASANTFSDALLALRFAQRDGGRTLVRVDDPVSDRLRIMQFIEENIGRAVTQGELFLTFQPKVSMRDRTLAGAEALIRWKHPERGLVSPALFIPVIERCGLAPLVSDWVLDNVAGTVRALADQGLATRIALNASGQELHAQFAERIDEAVGRHGIAPAALEVEITETSVVLDMAAAAEVTGRLRRSGIAVFIDDFGTGYSSLSYLRTFPLDGIKIDQSFVRGVTSNPIDRRIVEGVIGLAHALGLATVAEGVETPEQFEVLRHLGCDVAQGYLFGQPLALPEFQDFMRRPGPFLQAAS